MRQYRFASCTRCSCVFFSFDDETFICGRMRYADHWERNYAAFERINPPWQDDFEDDDVRLGFDIVKHIFGTQPAKAKGCAESLVRYHPLQEGYLAPAVEGRRVEITRFNNRLDERDCFYHFRGSITETI